MFVTMQQLQITPISDVQRLRKLQHLLPEEYKRRDSKQQRNQMGRLIPSLSKPPQWLHAGKTLCFACLITMRPHYMTSLPSKSPNPSAPLWHPSKLREQFPQSLVRAAPMQFTNLGHYCGHWDLPRWNHSAHRTECWLSLPCNLCTPGANWDVLNGQNG